MFRSFRHPLAAAAALTAFAATPAAADVLIGISDDDPLSGSQLPLSDADYNAAVGWTQAVTATVTVRAGLLGGFEGGPAANWWVTRAIGPAATAADVVASGTYAAPADAIPFDFDLLPKVTLASGLLLGPGAYWLVADGQPADSFIAGGWLSGAEADTTLQLAPGFALSGFLATDAAAAFGPSATFAPLGAPVRLSFGLEGVQASVPEPAAWALLVAGFAGLGAALRRARSRQAVPV